MLIIPIKTNTIKIRITLSNNNKNHNNNSTKHTMIKRISNNNQGSSQD